MEPNRLVKYKAQSLSVCVCVQLQNLGCYSVSKLELRIHLPSVAAGGRVFMNVTEVFSYNVSNNTKYIT